MQQMLHNAQGEKFSPIFPFPASMPHIGKETSGPVPQVGAQHSSAQQGKPLKKLSQLGFQTGPAASRKLATSWTNMETDHGKTAI